MIPGLNLQQSQSILSLFKEDPQISEVILFGSRAKGCFREGSDIDIAVKGVALTYQNRDELLRKYENLYLPWKLDIVIYTLIENQELKEHIDRRGVKL